MDEAEPETGSTPLNEAARKGHRDVVALLLAHGADRKRRDRSRRHARSRMPLADATPEAVELLIAPPDPPPPRSARCFTRPL